LFIYQFTSTIHLINILHISLSLCKVNFCWAL